MKFYKLFAFTILTFLTIVLHNFTNVSGQNMIMLAVMFVCTVILPLRYEKITLWDLLLLAIFLIEISTKITHPSTFRLSTVLYSGLFMIQFVVLRTLSSTHISISEYSKFIKYVVFAFAFVLMIQQLMEIAELDGFNRNGFFSTRWKMNSLAQEPSYLPPTIMMLMVSYVKMKELVRKRTITLKESFNSDKLLWVAVIYTMVGCGTTSSIFVLPVFLIFFFRKEILEQIPNTLIIGASLFAFLMFVFPYIVQRFWIITDVLSTFDPIAIYDADSSASARIAPYFILMKELDLTTVDFWFGHGVDYGTKHLSFILLGREMDAGIGIGGMVNFLYDYGVVSFVCLLIYMRKYCFKTFFNYDFICWFFIYTVFPFNTSSAWMPISFMMVNKCLEQKYKLLNAIKTKVNKVNSNI